MNIFELLFTQPIFNILLFIYSIVPGHDFGVAVIIFTILVRFAMWPLVRRQLHQSKVMRDLQPQLQQIRKKAKGNKQLEGQLMLELYKEKGVNPFSSFGILLIQLPFFIALYSSVNILATHREQIDNFIYPFLQAVPHLAEVAANPGRFNEMAFGFLDLTKTAFTAGSPAMTITLVVIALVTAVVQYIQSKQLLPQPKEKKKLADIFRDQAAGKDVDQAEVMAAVSSRTIMLLPVIIFIASLTIAGALSLYLLTTTVVGYLQQRRVLGQDTEEMETAAETTTVEPGLTVNNKPKKTKKSGRAERARAAKIVTEKPKKKS